MGAALEAVQCRDVNHDSDSGDVVCLHVLVSLRLNVSSGF